MSEESYVRDCMTWGPEALEDALAAADELPAGVLDLEAEFTPCSGAIWGWVIRWRGVTSGPGPMAPTVADGARLRAARGAVLGAYGQACVKLGQHPKPVLGKVLHNG